MKLQKKPHAVPYRQLNSVEYRLTSRQLEVLKLLTEGLSNKEIAQSICISENTVNSHVNVILQVLHVTKRIEAVREAHRIGLLT